MSRTKSRPDADVYAVISKIVGMFKAVARTLQAVRAWHSLARCGPVLLQKQRRPWARSVERLQDPVLGIMPVYWRDTTGQSRKHQPQLPAKATEQSRAKPLNETEPLFVEGDKDVCVVLLAYRASQADKRLLQVVSDWDSTP